MIFSAVRIRIIHKFLHLPIISFFLVVVFVPFSFRYLKTSKLELKCIGVVINKNPKEMSIDVRNRYDIIYKFTHLPKKTYNSIEKSDYFEKQAWENFCKVKNKKLKLLK